MRAVISSLLVFVLCSSAARATEPDSPDGAKASGAAGVLSSVLSSAESRTIPTIRLRDQTGSEVDLNEDLIRGRTVVVAFFYTRCAASCPAMASAFASLQRALGPRLGTSVALLSITTDPEHDTPEVLRDWAERVGARPGWSVLTGTREAVRATSMALTGTVLEPGMHTPSVLVGSGETGLWVRAYGLADTDRFLEIVDAVGRSKPPASANSIPAASVGRGPGGPRPADGPPSEVGAWVPAAGWPSIVAIHMSVLPDGKVLTWHGNGTPLDVRVWDPATQTASPAPLNGPDTPNLFCSGHAFLKDGRLLVAAGTAPVGGADQGITDATVFSTSVGRPERIPSMRFKRWYPSVIALPDGNAVALAGSFDGLRTNVATTPELWDSNANTWRPLTGGASDWYVYYPWVHVAPDGRIFNSGPGATRFLSTTGPGSVTPGPAPSISLLRDYGSSVMYDTGRVLIVGGGTIVQGSGVAMASASAESIDLRSPTPQWSAAGTMHFPRKQLNAVILPTGDVLAVGGTRVGGEPGLAYEQDIWGSFAIVGSPGNLGKTIAMSQRADGRLEVFIAGIYCDETGCDRERYGQIFRSQQQANGSFGAWELVGAGDWRARSLAVSRNPQTGLVDLVFNGVEDKTNEVECGNDCGNVHFVQQTGSNSWALRTRIGGPEVLAKTVATAPLPDGRIEVFMAGIFCGGGGCDRERYGSVFQSVQGSDGTFSPWADIGHGGRGRSLAVVRDLTSGRPLFAMNGVEDVASGIECENDCGNVHSRTFIDHGPVLEAELWNPRTNTWTVLAAMKNPRTYHSTAVLLPDARVLSAGGGQGGGPGIPNHLDAEIFSPPYLFRGPRPTIRTFPASISYGTRFRVESAQAGDVAKISLVRLPSTTHSYDENQRLSFLDFSRLGDALTVLAPANANLCPPGHYMLFLVDRQGRPSTASIVHVDQ